MKWVVCTTCCHVCKVVSIPKVAMMPGAVQTTPSFSYDSNDPLPSILFPLASSRHPGSAFYPRKLPFAFSTRKDSYVR
jgi:hypothetical protein